MAVSRIRVRVTPRASRDAVEPIASDDLIRLRVSAPPADGEANAAVTRLLARALDLPQRDIVLLSGASSRDKVFEVPLDLETVRARLQR